jgi:hypothetical protein
MIETNARTKKSMPDCLRQTQGGEPKQLEAREKRDEVQTNL